MEDLKKLNYMLTERSKEILRLRESIQKGETIQKRASNLLSSIHGRYRNLLEQNLLQLLDGKVTLTVRDFYQFWTDLHVDNNVVFFRCTSRIDPKHWLGPDMQLYERRQIANIKDYENRDPKDKENLNKLIKDKLKVLTFDGKNNFERIFIIEQIEINDNNKLDDLISVISRQVKGGIHVKTICVKSNEIPTFSRPQDFGIVITEIKNPKDIKSANVLIKLLMYLDVGKRKEHKAYLWTPEGGHIFFNEETIKDFEGYYSRIERKSFPVKTEDPEEIKQDILRQFKNVIDISEIYENRCYNCLWDAEQVVKEKKWEEDKTPKRTWFEIVAEENGFLRDILLTEKPRNILEIGCGAGRVIRFALELEKCEGSNPNIRWHLSSVEGYEQNTDICLILKDYFRGDSRVIIHRGLVGKDAKSGRFHHIKEEHRDRFDMVLAVSNLVGWQDNEEEWIREVLKAGESLFFTVYKKGHELERARMYQAAGDIITFREDGNIELIVDAFQDEKHVTKAYNPDEIEAIIRSVASKEPLQKPERFDGKYMFGYLLKKK